MISKIILLGIATLGGVSHTRIKILSCLATQFRGEIAESNDF